MNSLLSLISKRLKIALNLILGVFYTVFIFSLASLFIPPQTLWISEIATLLIPILVFSNCLLIPVLFIYKKQSITKWISIIFFLLSFIYFYNLFKVNNDKFRAGKFTLMSYNVSGFKSSGNENFRRDLINIINGKNADIVCLQEFLPDKYPFLETLYPYQVVSAKRKVVGVTIFSKYPIINQGIVFEGKSDFNKGIFADILVKGRLLRVVSVHFESTNLKKGNPFFPIHKVLRNVHWLKETSEIRSNQVERLTNFTDTTSLPIVVAGDFNETPYSYVYMQMKRKMKNGFEEKGNGFGFTFPPGRAFLRIDHQFFFPDRIKIESYETLNDIKLSDHVPVLGSYSFY